MLFRVSEAELYRQWREDEEAELETLVARLLGQEEPSDAMKAGTAFHRCLERAPEGEASVLETDGYRFLIECDIALALPDIRELRASKAYGPCTITGCVDALHALRIDDHKTTQRFDADRYLDGYQWRFYLDIFGAKRFRWNVFEMREIDPEDDVRVYSVFGHHTLEQCAYPSMHDDCMRLACDLFDFASIHVPERRQAA